MGKPIEEWGPKCARCGHEEYRIDGYCSVYCRDMAEVEDDRDRSERVAERFREERNEWIQRALEAEKEVNKLTLLLEEIRRVAAEPIPENCVGGTVDWSMIKLHKVWKIADSAFLEE